MEKARGALTRIEGITALPAGRNLVLHSGHAGPEFLLVIERGHYYMPPLAPQRVITVVTDDEAMDVIVVWVNSRHNPRVTRGISASSSAETVAWAFTVAGMTVRRGSPAGRPRCFHGLEALFMGSRLFMPGLSGLHYPNP
jgi:hypothetical protein